MKSTSIKLFGSAMLIALVALSSCSGNDSKKPSAPKGNIAAAANGQLPNYRYVDLDTILDHYNLAKDYNEEMLRMQTNMESTARQKESSLRNYANQVQKKYQNNTYLTSSDQQAIQMEQQKIESMQNQAQREMANLQNNYQTAAMKAQQTINDSIQKFIQEYNQTHGYDAIFFKGATLYINPALDITKEVIEGLNARYNKKK